jgi:hypothetical protein
MTARIHRLSPDIRRPGRMDLIIPVLDPEGEELDEFINWTFKGIQPPPTGFAKMLEVPDLVKKFSPASFASLRSRIKSKNCKTLEEVLAIASDMLEPDIEETREYQTLQAKVNCTRKSLLFDPETSAAEVAKAREKWKARIRELEAKGHR